jgi:hypothetical protein
MYVELHEPKGQRLSLLDLMELELEDEDRFDPDISEWELADDDHV